MVKEYEVEIDESKFDEEFLNEYNGLITNVPNAEFHMFNLAELAALGIVDDLYDDFIEGYGRMSDMGIKITELTCDIDSEEVRQ